MMTEYGPIISAPDTLCRSKFPLITRFHDYLQSANGIIDMDFTYKWFSHLTICKPTSNYNTAPPILMIGKQSDQRILFEKARGKDRLNQMIKSGKTPEPELEKSAAYGYEYAFENGAFCQEGETIIDTMDGKLFVPFMRGIWKYKDPAGRELIAYLSTHLSLTYQ